MKRSHLYTRTGDAGETSLVGGQRVPKTHVRLEAYGTIDELNSHIGLLHTYLTADEDRQTANDIQNMLFVIGAELATESDSAGSSAPTSVQPVPTSVQPAPTSVQPADIERLERAIDAAEEGLPGWQGFILPGGTPGAAQAHVCRTVCRRAERRIHALAETAFVHPLLLAYVNRLSDYFFALAKKMNHQAGKEETIWRRREK